MNGVTKKLLLVEGKSDLYAVVELAKKRDILWPDKRPYPVEIKDCGNDEGVIEEFPIQLKGEKYEVIGIIIDADDSCVDRWSELCRFFSFLPGALPDAGLIIPDYEGKRVGIWIMPDNISGGMLETFAKFLIPQSSTDPVLLHAESATKIAKEKGAKYKSSHLAKAEIYTWLAWQDEPAQTIGKALTQRILDSNSSHADNFIKWFKELFKL